MNGDDRDDVEHATFEITATVKRQAGISNREDRERPNPKAEKTSPPWHEWGRNIATIAAALVAVWALCLNYRALIVNTRAMQSSQRAWVLLDNESPNRLTRNGAAFHLRNFGHSPATISVIQPGMTLTIDNPDSLRMSIDDQPVPGPIPERILAPDRQMRIGFKWTPTVRPLSISMRIEYADPFDDYTYTLCLKPMTAESRRLIECPYNQRTQQRRDR